ncbi:hypothetical protein ONE63_007739 [Megalurothrips usitatus]|uniref:CRAL-TRIO domain-containing protein n=1 Tax=Megalurothrips usitatus TaxID=439358 RepID=A0AAV7XRZ1_9NEOP|nr:hypothetical protein ONE63_007739 [Megalurothrips usitatus]
MPDVGKELTLLPEDISPEDLKALYEEIGATPASLKRDAAALREWVNAEPHLPNLTSEHDLWLETFLMAGKNSMEKAKVRLDNYFSQRTELGDWFRLPPPPKDRQLADDSEFMAGGISPKLLPGGLVMLIDSAVIPPDGNWSRFDLVAHYQRALLYSDALMGESKKIRGLVYVLDQKTINLNVLTTFLGSVASFRKVMACAQEAQPMRVHSIHLANATAPSLQRMLLGAITPMLKGKLAQRIYIHSDNASLHKHIPPQCLPEAYGGTCKFTLESLSTDLCNYILSKRDWYESRMWMKSDESRRAVKKSSDLGMEGSFRKLAVD